MDDLNWIWQTVLIFYVGRFILRLGGRKSISQMTITQVIVMVGIGSLLIQPIAGKGLLITFLAALLLVILMIVTEYLELKFDIVETITTGKAVVVIEDGKVNLKNLKKIRMSIDRLETRLRQSGISSIDDVKYATIEVSGLLGYELKDHKKPLTKEEFITFMSQNFNIKTIEDKNNSTQNIFSEINLKNHEGKNEP